VTENLENFGFWGGSKQGLYLMFHAFAAKFDVTGNLEKFLVFGVN